MQLQYYIKKSKLGLRGAVMGFYKKSTILFVCLIPFHVDSFVVNRAIVSSNENPTYLEFWPIVAKAWKKIGIQPTLALIADDSVSVDESIGDVIRFEPIPDVPTSLYAQVVRLLLPIYFENDFCILSDIDMIPLNAPYFLYSAKDVDPSHFVVYRNRAYSEKRYPMCYNAAQGKTFKEIFNIDKEQIPQLVAQWHALGLNWYTDELMLYRYLHHWKYFNTRCVLMNKWGPRIDRLNWSYSNSGLQKGFYIDAHCLRPYSSYKAQIDRVLKIANIVV